MAELEAPWSVARDKATHTDMTDESVAPDAATQTAQVPGAKPTTFTSNSDSAPISDVVCCETLRSTGPAGTESQRAPRCGGGSRQVLLGWDSFRSRVLLALLVATVVWAAVYFPLISLA